MSSNQIVEMLLQVQVREGSDDEIDNTTRQLYSEINDLDVENVDYVSAGAAPEGTKSVDPTLIGLLIVSVAPLILTKFLDFLHAWCMRNENRTVKIKMQMKSGETLEIDVPAGMSRDETSDWINTVRGKLTSNKK